jgi:hypothetical protein
MLGSTPSPRRTTIKTNSWGSMCVEFFITIGAAMERGGSWKNFATKT